MGIYRNVWGVGLKITEFNLSYHTGEALLITIYNIMVALNPKV